MDKVGSQLTHIGPIATSESIMCHVSQQIHIRLPTFPQTASARLRFCFVFAACNWVNCCMEEVPQGSTQASPSTKPPKPRSNRLRYQNSATNAANLISNPSNTSNNSGRRRTRGPSRDHPAREPRSQGNGQVEDSVASGSEGPSFVVAGASGRGQNSKRRNPPRQTNDSISMAEARGPQTSRRGAKFNASLTEPSTEPSSSPISTKHYNKYQVSNPKGEDLTSTLIHALSTPPYPDCPICFAAIYPAQSTWSCSPSHATHTFDGDSKENENSQCCWTTFHFKVSQRCILCIDTVPTRKHFVTGIVHPIMGKQEREGDRRRLACSWRGATR